MHACTFSFSSVVLLNFGKMAKDAQFLALKELAIKQDELLKEIKGERA